MPEFGNKAKTFDVIGDNLIICEVRNHVLAPAMAEANARLIAAAPDLLLACKAVLRAWLDDEASLSEAVDTCIAAINKAEGV
jgi:hypothetical protein